MSQKFQQPKKRRNYPKIKPLVILEEKAFTDWISIETQEQTAKIRRIR